MSTFPHANKAPYFSPVVDNVLLCFCSRIGESVKMCKEEREDVL